MNREHVEPIGSRSRTLSMPSMARVGYEIEGGRRDTFKTERAFKERHEEPII